MNKKLILLILVLPLFLLFGIYTTTNSVGLNIGAPVSKIEISSNNIEYLDFDLREKYYINYTVYPKAASNKEITFYTEPVGDEKLAELDFVDGYIIPKSVGVAKVYLSTIDGGFKDSFIVRVDSTRVQEIELAVEKTSLIVGETIMINTTISPSNATNKMLDYSSSNSLVATVDDSGKITAIGKGSTIITVCSEQNPAIKDSVLISVSNKDILDLVQEEIFVWNKTGEIALSIDTQEEYELNYSVLDIYGSELADAIDKNNSRFMDKTGGGKAFAYTFVEGFVGDVVLEVVIETASGETMSKQCVLHKIDEIEASFDSDEAIVVSAGSLFAVHNKLNIRPQDASVRYEVELSNNNVVIEEVSDKIRLSAVLPGVTNLTLRIVSTENEAQVVVLNKEIVILPGSLVINESAETYGIENIWTVGGYEANGESNKSSLSLSAGKNGVGEGFWSNFGYVTDNPKVTLDTAGKIIISDDAFNDIVGIKARFIYNGNYVESPAFYIRCVGAGVNVRSFADLYAAANSKKIVVLQQEITSDFGKDANGNNIYNESTVKKIDSTYDTTYYKNIDKQQDAKIKVLLNFESDVYGNGHAISAHNVAYGLDAVGQLKSSALFRGPLNFVAMSESEGSLVSVKAQDNVSFAVCENVTLNNVELRSCDLVADSHGNYDLSDLTYVGTTVEVFGDNVNIEYCRINNGRTVLRAFGDLLDSTKVISINIKNSVLSCAREFVIRMGSNAFVDGDKTNPSPYIDGVERTFPMQRQYENMTAAQKREYEESYIKTFVNIKNSVLKDAGLFCIGIDTHFAGDALADGSGLAGGLIESWHDLAKTSFGAKLTFEDDVRMYDWKEVSNIDSSTLIEIVGQTAYSDLSFDIQQLIGELANNTQKPYLNTIVHNQNGKQYVHGGIAFFGGGKNYSVFEAKDYSFKVLNGYEVKLSDVGKLELQLAAGDESFYFLLNDSTTQGFLPDDQTAMLKTDAAYAPIYKKD